VELYLHSLIRRHGAVLSYAQGQFYFALLSFWQKINSKRKVKQRTSFLFVLTDFTATLENEFIGFTNKPT
jgi:hypothetical protein